MSTGAYGHIGEIIIIAQGRVKTIKQRISNTQPVKQKKEKRTHTHSIKK